MTGDLAVWLRAQLDADDHHMSGDIWESTPVEWKYNDRIPQYGGREWRIKCRRCGHGFKGWDHAKELPDDLAQGLRDALAAHINVEHPDLEEC